MLAPTRPTAVRGRTQSRVCRQTRFAPQGKALMSNAVHHELRQVLRFIETLSCGASIIDRNGRIMGVNQRLCDMMGRPRTEIEGQLVEDFYDDPTARASVHDGIRNFAAMRETEFYLVRPGGERVPMVSSARPLGTDGLLGEFRLVTMIDITPQKRAEEQAREQYKQISELSDTILEQALDLKRYSETLEAKVRKRTEQLRAAQLDAIYMLAVASEAKDTDTGHHVRRIQRYCCALADELGLDGATCEAIGYGSILHDVGKMHVPDAILKKPGALTPDERAVMETHTVVGERIVSGGSFFDLARRVARSHHENWDGSGYPDRLAGDRIPVEARIVHLADVFDALTNARVYKPAWTVAEAGAHIEKEAGRMFDPKVVDAFVRGMKSGKFHDTPSPTERA
jgi:PAS domain S-box-containing protein